MEAKIFKGVIVFCGFFFFFFHYLENELFYETCMLLMHTEYVSVHLPGSLTMNEAALDYLLCPVAVVSDQEIGRNQHLFYFYEL